jgi:hypothetical protein
MNRFLQCGVRHWSRSWAIALFCIVPSILISRPGFSLTEAEAQLLIPQTPDLTLLLPNASVPEGIVTANTIDQEAPTIPSLWWAKDQFGGKLLLNWIAYSPTQEQPTPHVDLIVSQDVWGHLTYLDRYTFLTQFAVTANDYGYDTRIFTLVLSQPQLLAAYICDVNLSQALQQAESAVAEAGESTPQDEEAGTTKSEEDSEPLASPAPAHVAQSAVVDAEATQQCGLYLDGNYSIRRELGRASEL